MSELVINGEIIDLEVCDHFRGSIVVKGNTIESVSTQRGTGARVIDASDYFILPGFIDAHVHIMEEGFKLEDRIETPFSFYFYNAIDHMRTTLNTGVTTIRDAGMADFGVKLASQKGIIPAPRMQISVTPLSITGGHFDFHMKSGLNIELRYPGLPSGICDGASEVRKKTREVLRAGADVIKIMATGGVMSANDKPDDTQFTKKELKIIVEEARFRGKRTMAHAHGLEGIKNCIEAGINSIEHGTYINKKTAAEMREKGVCLVPTLLVTAELARKAKKGELPSYTRKDAIEVAKVHRENIEAAYEEGVQLVMGTDSGVIEHGQNLKEFSYLSDIGMGPREILESATLKAVECIGWDDMIGSLDKGKLADIIVVKENPLEDIKSLADPDNILLVVKDGMIFKNLLGVL
ncbi:MAG TPA: amidohydrolase family protein [Methanothermobacter sp.]|jgi:imidazolonepropionase-like amidohydrolase|uniref:Aryldialkylphosphatase n=1 Tax=Methanothermobacter tenebrarum TaxID=680118 RepID=A0ABN6PGV4_9EURY|nr:amidohydrolase family protein [Methanothermobacter tenebrarum]MDD3454528.1 amidohydrolase family protein [Methanobacteriales archaeon]MDX9693769.1 amidohydrolase family protein [Methanothermobacter sp.]BDH80147.1 aryldialkylphosphatase [Methanothermobacter tenebrarum]HHW17262.1 amidohydrolase family protein [Methanothermobacter sp.]HOQ20170.1 amidohydrolase family protein [Methanothermobacter sp.]